MSGVSWDEIIAKMFEDTVATGFIAVLEAEGLFLTYSIHDGIAVFRYVQKESKDGVFVSFTTSSFKNVGKEKKINSQVLFFVPTLQWRR